MGFLWIWLVFETCKLQIYFFNFFQFKKKKLKWNNLRSLTWDLLKSPTSTGIGNQKTHFILFYFSLLMCLCT